MDISKASNFERFVFDLLARDGQATRALFEQGVAQDGYFDLSGHEAFKTQFAHFGFVSGKSTHAERLKTIASTLQAHDQLIDPHTADGLKVGREHLRPGGVMVVLETALPIKFSDTILEAVGQAPPRPAGFDGIEERPKRVIVMPANTQQVKDFMTEKCAL